MQVARISTTGEEQEEEIDGVEFSEQVIITCYVNAPKAVEDEFKEKHGRKFKAEDILLSDVFDELSEQLMGKPSKK